MKLLRYGPLGQEKPAILDTEGRIRDLSGHIDDLSGKALGRKSLAALAAIDPATLPLVEEGVRIGACVGKVGNFIGVGLNYADHARESNMPIPEEPIMFNKAPSCICGPYDDVILPQGSVKTDWEVELAIIIGEDCNCVSQADALEYVAGYCICNDLSEREYQLEHGGNWCKGKSYPTFGPIGPWLVTRDELPDTGNLDLWLDLNGERMQTGTSANMIFNAAFLVSYISWLMVLNPGDIITTGTPPGVGMGKKPQLFVKVGDVMSLGVTGLGQQRQQVI